MHLDRPEALFGLLACTIISTIGGNTNANTVQHKAPINEMKYSSAGTNSAIPTKQKEHRNSYRHLKIKKESFTTKQLSNKQTIYMLLKPLGYEIRHWRVSDVFLFSKDAQH